MTGPRIDPNRAAYEREKALFEQYQREKAAAERPAASGLAKLARPMASESTGTRATLPQVSPEQVARNNAQSVSEAKGIGREVVAGATLGLSGIVEAGARSAFGPRSYHDVKSEIDTERDAFKRDNPGIATLANVGGGLMTGGVVAKALPGLATLRTPFTNPLTVSGRIADAAAKGAVTGAVSGAANAKEGERMQGAATGLAVGAGGGALIAGGAEGASKLMRLARGVWNGNTMTPAVEEAGQLRVLSSMARAKKTPADLTAWDASADPADLIAEGIGQRGVRQLGSAHRLGYQSDDIATALDARAADEGARFANTIERASGKTARDAATVKQEALSAIEKKRSAFYKRAYQQPDVDAPEVMQVAAELNQMKDGRVALSRASDLAVGKNTLQDWADGSTKVSVANLHNLREGIDHAIDVAKANADDQMVRALQMRRSVVDRAFKDAGGKAARQADKLHAQAMAKGEAFAAGEKLAQGAVPQSRNAEGIAEMAANTRDPDAFAHGVASDFITKAANTPSGIGGQPQNPAKIVNGGLARLRLRQGLPDDDAMQQVMDAAKATTNRMKTRTDVLLNSKTAERFADDAAEAGAPLRQLAAGARNPVSASLNWAGGKLDALRGRATGAELDAAAKLLMAGAPGQMTRAEAITLLQQQGPRISSKMLKRGTVRGLLGSSTGNVLLDELNR